jgi:hypothetical protein
MVNGAPRKDLLKVYEHETEPEIGGGERLFQLVVFLSFLLFGAAGWYLKTHNPPPQVMEEKMARARQVSFIIEEKKKVEAVVEKPKPKPAAPRPEAPKEPIDLTTKPKLDQKTDDTKPEPPPEPEAPEVRRVYGLRKVYSTGLGADGSAADAVVGKLGNTLATDIDTLTASKNDLKGKVAPITTVQTLPKLKTAFKPEYTPEMIENEVEGVVSVKLLIGVNGRVKEVVVLNDLGYGSKDKIIEACLKLVFEPALVNGQPVATWFIQKFRFELTQ